MGHNSVISGHSKCTRIPRVDGLSTGPLDLRRHIHKRRATVARQSGQQISAEFITSSFPPNDSLINPQYKVPKANCFTKRFVFSAEKLDELKALANTHGAENPTRVQVVSALIYKFVITALRASKSGSWRASVLHQIGEFAEVCRKHGFPFFDISTGRG